MQFLLKLLVLMLVLVPNCLAATLSVRSDGSGDYTSIAAAVGAATSGDSIIIGDSSTYSESTQAVPGAGVTGVTLAAAAGQNPVWNFTALGVAAPALTFNNNDGWSIEGIKFVYNGVVPSSAPAYTSAIRVAGSSPAITKCSFVGNMGAAIFYDNGAANAGTDISYSSFYMTEDVAAGAQDVYAIYWATTFTGSFQIDHCTIGGNGTAGGGNRIFLWDNAMANTIVLTNALFFGNELGYACIDFAGSANLSYAYTISSVTVHAPGWLGTPVDAGNNSVTTTPGLNSPGTGDFSLVTGSPAIDAASDGSNIGAWQEPVVGPHVPVTLTVRANGTGDYTSIVSAVNAAQNGDTVLVDDSAVYAEVAQAAPLATVTSLTLTVSPGETPTWDFTALGTEAPALTIPDGTNWLINGIRFLYTGPQPSTANVWTSAIRVAGNAPRVAYCSFVGNMGSAIYYGTSGAANAGVDVSYCTFFLLDDQVTTGDIYALFYGVNYTGSFEIDHCTFASDGVSGGGNRIFIWDNAPGGSTIKLTNNIFLGNELGYFCFDFAGTANMSFAYTITSASSSNPGWLGAPVDLGNNAAVPNSGVADPANGDFSLLIDSPALGAAADGSNIGAWQGETNPVTAVGNWAIYQ